MDNPQHEWVSLVTSRQGAWERAGTIGHVSAASSNRLGDFLRASRARLDPADAGLIGGGSRRVPGLRREEVAVLAGVSADYYARLEQGRERNPSAQVIDAIGRALCLTPHARGHAYRQSRDVRVTVVSPGFTTSELTHRGGSTEAQAAARAAAEELAIPASAIAEAIGYAIGQPGDVDVNELVIRPTVQA